MFDRMSVMFVVPTAASCLRPASTSASSSGNEYGVASFVLTEPLILLRLMTTPVARMLTSQLRILPSMSRLLVVIVHDPEYAVSAVPGGMPVFVAAGEACGG